MSKFSASDAAFVGFRLVREHPKTVAIWAALMTVLSILSSVALIKFAGPQMEAFALALNDKDSAPEQLAKALADLGPMLLWAMPYSLALRAIVLSTVNRVVLRPAESRLAYLRLGADELRLAGVVVLSNLLFFGVLLAGLILTTSFLSAGGAVALLGLVTFVGSGCLLVYLAVRLSLAAAMTFDTGCVVLFRSMPLTKGQFAPLLGAYVLAFVMSIIVALLTTIIVVLVGLIVSGNLGEASGVFKSDLTSLETYFTPIGMVRTLFSGSISTLTTLIVFSPAAEIYRLLKAPPATFDASV